MKGSMNYRMTYDYHTHTVFSHGKGSIADNVMAARERGLRGVGITDHGPGHLTYGIKRESVPIMRAEIEELKRLYDDIEIYLGVEANIVSSGSCLDVSPEEFKDYDYVIAGYHYGVRNGYCVRNFAEEHLPLRLGGNGLLVKNTEMAVRCIYENDLKILTHPGDKGPFDMRALAMACADNDTLMEISTWHKHLTVEEMKIASLYDVKFVISSDAHTVDRVGDFEQGLLRAFEAGIDPERIVNIEEVRGE